MKAEYPTLEYADAAAWRAWLDGNHASVDGIWLRMYKKASGVPSVYYAEALDEALCYGWIDGQVKKYDEVSYLQKFTPRRPRSLWSKRNIEYISRLTESGKMMPAGLAEVERAKSDGRWEAAYDKPSEMKVPDYFQSTLDSRPNAKLAFESLNKTNRYAILWNLQTAKTEATRIRRMEKFLVMLEEGRKLY